MLIAASLIGLIALIAPVLVEPANAAARRPGNDAAEFQFEIGYRGHAKLGCWQPFFITIPKTFSPQRFEITVLDGDDAPITYAGVLHSADGQTQVDSQRNQYQGYVKLGRSFGTANVKLIDKTGSRIAQQTFPLGRTGSFTLLESTQRMILCLEPSQSVAKTVESTTFFYGREKPTAVISLNSAASLPQDWFCYEGIDTILLVTGDDQRIQSITTTQWNAIERWVENGGRLIFSVSANSPQLLGIPGGLYRFLPGDFVGLSEIKTSGRLEAFASSNRQFVTREDEPIAIANIEKVRGRVILEQSNQPLIVRAAQGFGEVVFVAFDLDDPRIVQWKGYSNLVHRLVSDVETQVAAQASTSNARMGSVSHYGYEDLIGQLRVPLERFNGVQFLAFNWIALLIGLYILCIGPGDYFFLRKLTGKMELTWLTFPALSLLFCGLAVWIASATRPSEIQLNQLELIDIDAQSNFVRGTVWSNLYSPRADEFNISLDPSNCLGFEIQSDLLSWHGLPGSGLGGMQTKTNSGVIKSGYQHTVKETVNAEGGVESHSLLTGVPIYVSATKPIYGQYNATFPTPIRSNLKLPLGSGRLDGTLINPLNVPLKNVRLLFESYAYVLKNSQLDAGEAIDVMTEMKERTVRSLLTRRTKSETDDSKTQSSPWQQTETRIGRIADMIMFHEAAGGNNYTGLTHAYQDHVDLSEHLVLGRAVLVGELDSLGTTLVVNGEKVTQHYDQAETIVRIVLPVEYEE